MPDTSKENRSSDDARTDAETAINEGATKIVLRRNTDTGNWDITITKPAPTGGADV